MAGFVMGALLLGGLVICNKVDTWSKMPAHFEPGEQIALKSDCDLWSYDRNHKPLVVRKGRRGESFKFVQRDGPKSTEVRDGDDRALWIVNRCVP